VANAPSAVTGAKPLDVKTRRRPFGLLAIIVIQLLTMLVSGLVLTLIALAFLLANRIVVVEGAAPPSFQLPLAPIDIFQMALTFMVNATWRLHDQRSVQLFHKLPP
jgi:hypothetical protein